MGETVTKKSHEDIIKEIKKGGKEKYHQKNAEQGKLFVRERLKLLFDEDVLIEDGIICQCHGGGFTS